MVRRQKTCSSGFRLTLPRSRGFDSAKGDRTAPRGYDSPEDGAGTGTKTQWSTAASRRSGCYGTSSATCRLNATLCDRCFVMASILGKPSWRRSTSIVHLVHPRGRTPQGSHHPLGGIRQQPNREIGDRAGCIAVGIYPELLSIRVTYDRALKMINEEFSKAKVVVSSIFTVQTVSLVRYAYIQTPPVFKKPTGHDLPKMHIALAEPLPRISKKSSKNRDISSSVFRGATAVRTHSDRPTDTTKWYSKLGTAATSRIEGSMNTFRLGWFTEMQASRFDRTQLTDAYSAQSSEDAVHAMSLRLYEYRCSTEERRNIAEPHGGRPETSSGEAPFAAWRCGQRYFRRQYGRQDHRHHSDENGR